MDQVNHPAQDSQILTAIKSASSSELVALLFRFGLADVFLKALKERELVFSDPSLSSPNAVQAEALSQFKSANQLKTNDDVAQWCLSRGMKEDDFLSEAIHAFRAAEFRSNLLDTSRESLFLRYKDNLDRVLYSMIRVPDEGLCREIFYSIEANEVTFGAAATKYSSGPEAKTQGIVGPVDLTVPHPEISSRLRMAQAGALIPPFLIDDQSIILRLEYRYDSVFDDKTKSFLEDVAMRTHLNRNIKDDLMALQAWVQAS